MDADIHGLYNLDRIVKAICSRKDAKFFCLKKQTITFVRFAPSKSKAYLRDILTFFEMINLCIVPSVFSLPLTPNL